VGPLSNGLLRGQAAIGIFESHSDVGTVLHAGAAAFDPARGTYTLQGSGENMWLTSDAFQFAWKKMSGDVELRADISFPNTTGNPHKKAVLMFRQSLDADSAYVDVALHGNGLTALQFRDGKGALTREVQSNQTNQLQGATKGGTNEFKWSRTAAHLRLTRRGDYVYLSAGSPGQPGGPLHYNGESIRVVIQGEFYVGIGVCAHDKNVVAEARFSDVELKPLVSSSQPPVLFSTLETVAIASADRQVVYVDASRFEAPNWSRDGTYVLFNRAGHLEKLGLQGGQPEMIDTGSADHLNNDHGISPNGTELAISDNSEQTKSANGTTGHDSVIYVLPISGGTPRRVTKNAPSYWHGWSPDGKTLALVGQREGKFDIYTIAVSGGDETRLTTAGGLNDGPEYSPDGQYIYFNSERTGQMQIWRMRSDGTEQTQVFSDEFNDWFPHISPDGQWMVFLTYGKDVSGHPQNKDVLLRLMSLKDKKITDLAKLFGGQGTINVPSWSPDSKSLAFVSFQFIAAEDAQAGSH